VKRGSGRPRFPKGEAKAAIVNIRLTLDEKRELDETVQRLGLSLSEWARQILIEAAQRTR